MKTIIYIAFIALTSIGVYAQESTQQELSESSKALALKVSQELNFDDNQTLYLQRAIYSTKQTKQRVRQQFGSNTSEYKDAEKKIDNQFVKMLKGKFNESEIATIKEFVAKEE